MPTTVVITREQLQRIAESYIPWLGPFIAPFYPVIIDTPSFCAGEPPGWPTIDATDLLALVTNGRVGNFLLAQSKLQQAASDWAWYQLCECSSAPQPSLPAGPSAPSDLPVFGAPVGDGSYLAEVLADAPIHFWRCADPGGGFLHDIGAGSRRALTLVSSNSPLAYSGPNSDGGSLWADASTGAWHFSGDTAKSPSSIECWVWRHTTRSTAETICSFYQNLQFKTDNKVLFASGGPNVTSVATPTEQSWHHLVGTYGPTGGAKLYIDGALDASGAYGASYGPFAQKPAVGMSDAGGAFATCNISEVAVYDFELSATRVAAHYAAANSPAIRPTYKGIGTFSESSGGQALQLSPIPAARDPYDLVLLIQRQAVPFGYVVGTAHAGLVDTGELAIVGLLGVLIEITAGIGIVGTEAGAPVQTFEAGWVTWGNADGFTERTMLSSASCLSLPRAAGQYTRVGYTLSAGIEVTITELEREP